MAVPAPDAARLAALSEHFGFGLSGDELAEYAPAVAGTLASTETVERLYARTAPAVPERAHEAPASPLGAWARRTSSPRPTAARWPGAPSRSRTTSRSPACRWPTGPASLAGYVPSRDATVVRRVLDAGATIAGKATCEDLCFSGASFTSWPAPVRNPWDPQRNAGGSSSGAAALLASGQVDLAVGGDQGGSVRIPASFCGIVGHKPTYGLVPYTGAFPIEQTIDHLGPMARSVADVALLLGVLAGVDGDDARQPAVIEAVDYLAALGQGAAGLRGSGSSGRGSARRSPSPVWTTRCARVWRCCAAPG